VGGRLSYPWSAAVLWERCGRSGPGDLSQMTLPCGGLEWKALGVNICVNIAEHEVTSAGSSERDAAR